MLGARSGRHCCYGTSSDTSLAQSFLFVGSDPSSLIYCPLPCALCRQALLPVKFAQARRALPQGAIFAFSIRSLRNCYGNVLASWKRACDARTGSTDRVVRPRPYCDLLEGSGDYDLGRAEFLNPTRRLAVAQFSVPRDAHLRASTAAEAAWIPYVTSLFRPRSTRGSMLHTRAGRGGKRALP